jgi:hypothetical protein
MGPWVSEAADWWVVKRLPAEEGARVFITFAEVNLSAANSWKLRSGAGDAAVEAYDGAGERPPGDAARAGEEALPGSAVEEDEAEEGVTLEALAEKKPVMD